MDIIKSLPVYKEKDKILQAVEENDVIIVESPTGSGKTTGIPIILYESGYANTKQICVTQPRRIAALNVSEFIKSELGFSKADSRVAAKMRFYDETQSDTQIKIMTDGILLEEMKKDPLLENYSIIMIDEAHERSLNIDFILGLLKSILEKRNNLKVIISSATINTSQFSKYFNSAPIISIEGKMFDVDVVYSPLSANLDRDKALVEKIVEITQSEVAKKSGDILVFLPGEKLINETCNSINRADYKKSKIVLYPLYSKLSREDQLRVFIPTGKNETKIVVATNIAETSITINGIKVVIDSGLQKINFYDQNNFTSSLVETPIARSSAMQRKGRAGRVDRGICYRLYKEKEFNMMSEFQSPEILRSDLSEVVLRMVDLGIKDAERFPFIDKISPENIISAYNTLTILGAIDSERNLTEIGKFMVKFPLPPRLARILAESVFNYPGTLANICTILAFLSTKSPFLVSDTDIMISRKRQSQFASTSGDLVSYLEVFDYYKSFKDDKEARDNWCDYHFIDPETMGEIANIKQQLEEMLSDANIPVQDDCSEKEYILCLCAGLRQFICKRMTEREYATSTAKKISIHPSSLYKGPLPDYFVSGEIVQTTRMFARSLSPVPEAWLKSFNLSFPRPSKKAKALKDFKSSHRGSGKHSHDKSKSRKHHKKH